MNETHLLRICIGVGIVGIISLFFIAQSMEAIALDISSLTDEMIGKNVAVNGVVKSLRISDGMTLFDLRDELGNEILVVFFEEKEITEGTTITVTGTVKEYRGQLEIIGERVEGR